MLFNPQRGLGGLQEAYTVILAAIIKEPRLFLYASFSHAPPRGPETCMAALKIPVGMPVNAIGGYNKSVWNGIINMSALHDTIYTLAI